MQRTHTPTPKVLAAALVGMLVVLAATITPASADYAPYVIISPAEGPPGTVISVENDYSGQCEAAQPSSAQGGSEPSSSVVVQFGSLADLPDIGGFVTLDEVLASVEVLPDAQGNWKAQITVPDGIEPGENYAVTAHCNVPDEQAGTASTRALLFDYFPARFTVLGEVTTTTVTSPTTPPPTAPPAVAVEDQADFTG